MMGDKLKYEDIAQAVLESFDLREVGRLSDAHIEDIINGVRSWCEENEISEDVDYELYLELVLDAILEVDNEEDFLEAIKSINIEFGYDEVTDEWQ